MTAIKYTPKNEWANIEKKIIWEKRTLKFKFSFSLEQHYYSIFYGELDGHIYVKPAKEVPMVCSSCKQGYGYHSCEYEELFNFAQHCDNFDENTIVELKNLK